MIVLDIETTGFMPQSHKITEIGALKVVDGRIVETFSKLINPEVGIPKQITDITGITDRMVYNQPTIRTIMPLFVEFCEDDYIVGHNVGFDYSFLKTNANSLGLPFEKYALDTLMIAKILCPTFRSRSLTNLCDVFGIHRVNAHRAYDDAFATYQLLQCLLNSPGATEHVDLFVPKPIHYKIKKDSPITTRQLKFLEDLCNRYNVQIEKPIETFTKSEASKKIDLILSTYGRTNC